MRRAGGLLLALCLMLAIAPSPAAAEPSPIPIDGGAWCWFGDPRAVYDPTSQRVFIGYVTNGGDVVVSTLDRATQRVSTTALASPFQKNDHASPALHIRADGHLVAFWSAHNGGQMLFRVSTRPRDASEWGPRQVLPVENSPGAQFGWTYPNAVQAGGRLFLFWRGGGGQPTFTSSDDGAATWAPSEVLVNMPGQRPYAKYERSGETIHVAFSEGHPSEYPTGIYYAAFRDGRLFRADGTKIADAPPIAPSAADRVWDGSSGTPAWVWDAADDGGRPVIVYATFPGLRDHRYRYARWTGSRWEDHEIAAAGPAFLDDPREARYSAGIVLDHADPSTVYLARMVDGVAELERRRTSDGGKTWTTTALTSRSTSDNVRPVVPRGLPGSVIWMQGRYDFYTDYETRLLIFPSVPESPPPAGAAPPPPAGAAPPQPAGHSARQSRPKKIGRSGYHFRARGRDRRPLRASRSRRRALSEAR